MSRVNLLAIAFINLILINPFVSQAQSLVDELADDSELMVRQVPNSETAVKSYFQSFETNDTIYAIIFPPSNCPRCESIMSNIYPIYKQMGQKEPFVLISAYPDSIVAKQYNERYGYKADYFKYDTSEEYSKLLSFSFGTLHIPYLLKFSLSEGKLIVGVNADEAGKTFLKEFVAYNTPKEAKSFDIDAEYALKYMPKSAIMSLLKSFQVNTPDSILVSEIIYQPEFVRGNLLFNDKLRNSILRFKIENNSLNYHSEICTNSVENRTFSKIDSIDYDDMLNRNELKFIALSPKMLNENELCITYSLPNLWYVEKSNVGYMNKKAALIIDLNDQQSRRLIPLTADDNEDFFYPHFSVYSINGDIVIGCERLTWPVDIDKEEYIDIPEKNPFCDDFYRFSQPIMAIFDSQTGDLKQKFGQLPSISNQTKTGYYFMAPLVDTNNNQVVSSDGLSGEVNVSMADSPNKIIKTYKIFNIDDLPTPNHDKFYTYECVAPYNPYICRNIIDLKLTSDHIYCLLRYGIHSREQVDKDLYSVVIINRNNGNITEYQYPHLNSSTLAHGLWRNEDGDIMPYDITKDGKTILVNIYQ